VASGSGEQVLQHFLSNSPWDEINYPPGFGYVALGTGMLLSDDMDDFSAKPGVPNVHALIGDSKCD